MKSRQLIRTHLKRLCEKLENIQVSRFKHHVFLLDGLCFSCKQIKRIKRGWSGTFLTLFLKAKFFLPEGRPNSCFSEKPGTGSNRDNAAILSACSSSILCFLSTAEIQRSTLGRALVGTLPKSGTKHA